METESGGVTVQTNVSELVGHVIIDVVDASGKAVTLRLDNLGFDDWSAAESRLLRDKRARIVKTAIDAGKLLLDQEKPGTPEYGAAKSEAESLKVKALSLAGNIVGLDENDHKEILSRPEGAAVFLWSMIERRYPGKFSVDDVAGFVRRGQISEETMVSIMETVALAMGMGGSEGNRQGQGK